MTTEEINIKLENMIKSIESLLGEKRELSQQISDIYKEAKKSGYDTKIMREIIKLRKLEEDERVEQKSLLETYCKALNINF